MSDGGSISGTKESLKKYLEHKIIQVKRDTDEENIRVMAEDGER